MLTKSGCYKKTFSNLVCCVLLTYKNSMNISAQLKIYLAKKGDCFDFQGDFSDDLIQFFKCLGQRDFYGAYQYLQVLEKAGDIYELVKYRLVLAGFVNISQEDLNKDLLKFRFMRSYRPPKAKFSGRGTANRVALLFGQFRSYEKLKENTDHLLKSFDKVVISTWFSEGEFTPHNDESLFSLFNKNDVATMVSQGIDFDCVNKYGWDNYKSEYVKDIARNDNVFFRRNDFTRAVIPVIGDEQLLEEYEALWRRKSIKSLNQIKMAYLLQLGAVKVLNEISDCGLVWVGRADMNMDQSYIRGLGLVGKQEKSSVYVNFIGHSKYTRICDFSYYGGSSLAISLSSAFCHLSRYHSLFNVNYIQKEKLLMPHNWLIDLFILSGMSIKESALEKPDLYRKRLKLINHEGG